MNWILLAIGAYFLLSIESIANKYLISGKVGSWKLYLFYIGLLSFTSLMFAPFGLYWAGWKIAGISLVTGIIFFGYLAFLFSSLKGSTATRVFVLIGAVATLTTFVFSKLFLTDDLTASKLLGIVLLLLGGFLISFKINERRLFTDYKKVIIAGILLGVSLGMLKYTFDLFGALGGTSLEIFVNGYIYTRMGSVLMVILLMFLPSYRKDILSAFKKKKGKEHASNFLIVVGVKTLSGIATFMMNFALSIGDPTIVSALASVQYLGVFVMSLFLSKKFGNIFRENFERKDLIFKSAGVLLVILGIFGVFI